MNTISSINGMRMKKAAAVIIAALLIASCASCGVSGGRQNSVGTPVAVLDTADMFSGKDKEIGYSDFSSCTGLTTVTLNEGTEIGDTTLNTDERCLISKIGLILSLLSVAGPVYLSMYKSGTEINDRYSACMNTRAQSIFFFAPRRCATMAVV